MITVAIPGFVLFIIAICYTVVMDKKVTIEIDAGDAQAAYVFLRQTVHRLVEITKDMPAERQEFYLDQPQRWDRIAIALGEAAGEVNLPSLIPERNDSHDDH